MKSKLIYIILSLIFLLTSCENANTTLNNVEIDSIEPNLKISKIDTLHIIDSLTLEGYKEEITNNYVDDSLLTKDQIDSILFFDQFGIEEWEVSYSPDSLFKIYVIEESSVGFAYTTMDWHAWLHFNFNDKKIIKQIDVHRINKIHILSDNKYLVIDNSWGREGTSSTECYCAYIISIINDSVIVQDIKYPHKDQSSFCTDSHVEGMDESPYLKYNEETKTLEYKYGENNNFEIDSIWSGEYKYIDGDFKLLKEKVKVYDRRKLNDK